MSELKNQFLQSEALVNESRVQVPETLKMRLYGLAKQAKEGDCRMPQPPSSNTVLRAKWDAWTACAGMVMEKAMQEYVNTVEKLEPSVRSSERSNQTPRKMPAAEAITNPSIRKQGILYKQRDVFKGWRPRHFVLQDNMLHYYIDPDDPAPRNTLDITGCSVSTTKSVVVEGTEYFPFTISHPKSKTSYTLACDSKLEADIWVAKIIDASLAATTNNATTFSEITSSVTLATNKGSSSNNAPSTGSIALYENTAQAADTRAYIPREHLDRIEKAVREMVESNMDSDPGWEPLFVKDGLTAKKKSGSLVWVKGQISLPFSLLDTFGFILDPKNQNLIDPQQVQHDRLREFSNHTWVDYIRYKGVWPTSPRDFVSILHWRYLQDGRLAIVAFSQAFDELKPPVDGHIRADMVLGGYLLTPLETGTQVDYLVKLDLKGSIPVSVTNFLSNSQPMLLMTLRKLMMNAKKQGLLNSPPNAKTNYSELVTMASNKLYDPNAPSSSAPAAKGSGNSASDSTGTAAAGNAANTSKSASSSSNTPTLRGSSQIKYNSMNLKITPISLLVLFLPVLLYYIVEGPWRSAAFLFGFIIAANYLIQLHLGRPQMKSSLQLPRQIPGGKIVVRFPVDLGKLLVYLEAKRTESEVELTFTHVVVKACGQVLSEMRSLNGHIVMNNFYRTKTPGVDISCSVDVNETQTAVVKVSDADAKPVEFIGDEIINSARGLRSGGANQLNPYVKNLQGVLPSLLGVPLRRFLYRLGAEFGLSVPALDIVPFPLGVCTVVSSPSADKDSDVDVAMIPDSDSSIPITVTMGGLRVMPSLDSDRKLSGSPVLNFTVSISTKAGSLAEARKFCSKLQDYLSNPNNLEKAHQKAVFDRTEAAKRISAFGKKK